MRYELRKWTDSNHNDYTVVARSDARESLQSIVNRPSTSNEMYYRFFIVDTESEEKD
jgi:hypothetical protein